MGFYNGKKSVAQLSVLQNFLHDSVLSMRSSNTLTQELRIRSAIPFVRIFVEWPPWRLFHETF